MNALLVHQSCAATIEEEAKLPKDVETYVKVKILEKEDNEIMLCLADKVLSEVVDQTITVRLWEKLSGRYQKNYLTNRLH